MPHYTLVTTDGESLRAFRLAGHEWDVGDVIPQGLGDQLRVVDVLDSDDPEKFGVEPA